MTKAVFCIAPNIEQNDNIVNSLNAVVFTNNELSVLLTDQFKSIDFAYQQLKQATEIVSIEDTVRIGTGAVLGWLTGIGSLAIPGAGPLIAAVVGVTAGGITGVLVEAEMPNHKSIRNEETIKAKSVLFSVHLADREV